MDRTLWARFGEATLKAPHAIQWLSDNGPQYTARATVLYAHELGLVPITTPAFSPESNGLAEAFVGTFKRDYLGDAELRDAENVRTQLGAWFDDYNTQAPHSALGMRSPRDYRALTRRRLEQRRRRQRRRICPRTRDRRVGRYLGIPHKSGWSRPVRTANLQLPTCAEKRGALHGIYTHLRLFDRFLLGSATRVRSPT